MPRLAHLWLVRPGVRVVSPIRAIRVPPGLLTVVAAWLSLWVRVRFRELSLLCWLLNVAVDVLLLRRGRLVQVLLRWDARLGRESTVRIVHIRRWVLLRCRWLRVVLVLRRSGRFLGHLALLQGERVLLDLRGHVCRRSILDSRVDRVIFCFFRFLQLAAALVAGRGRPARAFLSVLVDLQ